MSSAEHTPIEALQDTLGSRSSLLDRQSYSYYAIGTSIDRGITRVEERGLSPELYDEIAYCVALRGLLRVRVLDAQTQEWSVNDELAMASLYDELLAPYEITMATIVEHANELSISAILDYIMGKLESHSEFLLTGALPNNWPEASSPRLDGAGALEAVRVLAEIINLSIHDPQSGLGDNRAELVRRHSAWLNKTCDAFLSRGLISLAVPLINTAVLAEDEAAMVVGLTSAMARAQTAVDAEEYSRLGRFLTRNLREPLKAAYLRNMGIT